MKDYYQQITRDNCALLDKYESEVAELLANQKKNATYLEMAMKERDRLKTPLEAALAEVADYQFKLKEAPKTKQTLQGAMGRLKLHQKRAEKLDREVRYAVGAYRVNLHPQTYSRPRPRPHSALALGGQHTSRARRGGEQARRVLHDVRGDHQQRAAAKRPEKCHAPHAGEARGCVDWGVGFFECGRTGAGREGGEEKRRWAARTAAKPRHVNPFRHQHATPPSTFARS